MGKRIMPVFFNKLGTVNKGKTVRVTNCHIPRGLPIKLMPVWSRGLKEGFRMNAVDNSGNIYLTNGVFTPIPPTSGASHNLRGQILGKVLRLDTAGQQAVSPSIVSLGRYKILDQTTHVRNALEIVPTPGKANKLTVIERRVLTKGLVDDASAHIYNIKSDAAAEIERAIPDLGWIQDIRITEDKKALITYQLPNGTKHTLTLEPNAFIDNFGKMLLDNKRAKISSLTNIYQSDVYVPETGRFQPKIDYYNGSLRLILHKVDRYEIDKPKDLDVSTGTVKIFPSAANAAIQVKGEWLPLTLDQPLRSPDLIHLGETGFSKVQEGETKSVIGPQTRVGNEHNMSLEYPRDPYFYGLNIRAPFYQKVVHGENFGINRGKSLRARRGIQSGRTHMMPWELLFDELFADVMETNSQYGKKLSNYAHWLWGPGVSEDTQMEAVAWMLGARMYVVKEMVAFMTAEKAWGNYNTQNTKRYNLSESLFVTPFRLVLKDLLHDKFLNRLPAFMSWQAMSEIAAGRTWYKWVLGKFMELGAIPVFLSMLGTALWFPVDLTYYIIAWSTRTIFSSIAYMKQLTSIGYGAVSKIGHDITNNMNYNSFTRFIKNPLKNLRDYFKTGFWRNVAYELSFLNGYLGGALKQHNSRMQFATFALTVGGSPADQLKASKKVVAGLGIATGIALSITSLSLFVFGGLSQLIFPLGIAIVANVFFGLYGIGLILKSLSLMKRELKKPAEAKKEADFEQEFGIEHAQYNLIAQKLDKHASGEITLSYEELFNNIHTLKAILKTIGCLKGGATDTGFQNSWRNVGNVIIELYTNAEMIVCVEAIKALRKDKNDAEARLAIKKLLRETREYIVMETASKLYWGLGLNL